MFQSPGDVAFSFLGFSVYYYGIILAVAIFVGVYTSYLLYEKFYDREKAKNIIDFAPLIIIIGIVGARLYYCCVNYSYYLQHPTEIFYIRQGGLSIHGMIIVGILALYCFAKIYKLSFLKLIDVFLCGTSLGQCIGRWGNFFNSEAFGTPTNLPWKLYIPIQHRPVQFIDYQYFHPAFLYESILDLIIFIILLSLFKKLSKYPGILACSYLIMYSFVRIFVEHLRIDSVLNIGGIPVAQLMSLILIIFAVILMIVIFYKDKNLKY